MSGVWNSDLIRVGLVAPRVGLEVLASAECGRPLVLRAHELRLQGFDLLVGQLEFICSLPRQILEEVDTSLHIRRVRLYARTSSSGVLLVSVCEWVCVGRGTGCLYQTNCIIMMSTIACATETYLDGFRVKNRITVSGRRMLGAALLGLRNGGLREHQGRTENHLRHGLHETGRSSS
jgi:hypothetical protein